jgi:hypothetical protein
MEILLLLNAAYGVATPPAPDRHRMTVSKFASVMFRVAFLQMVSN